MSITDDRATTPAPAATPPSYVRRHPILAAFAVLSGLSLFSALWPVSAVVVAIAVAGHATGMDRAALLVAERVIARIRASERRAGHEQPAPVEPAPAAPAPSTPEPSAPAPSAPRREAHPPVEAAARSRRDPHAPLPHRSVRTRRTRTPEAQIGSRADGPGL